MARQISLFTGQWGDLPIEELAEKISEIGYQGLELACKGNHLEIDKADDEYCQKKLALLKKYNLKVFAISAHSIGQVICDNIDKRHKVIVPDYIWGDGTPEKIKQRATEELIKTAHIAKKMGVEVITGFTGSSIWHLLYSFPPVTQDMIETGFTDFAKRWKPILDEFQKLGIKFALEVHPTEIAFDIVSAERTLEAIDYHPAFGFNYDPSHLAYQGVDYLKFLYKFSDKIFNVHMKDVYWSNTPTEAGVFGGYLNFGDNRRFWNFRSLGRGNINFEEIIRTLNDINYNGSLSVEWEDNGMDRFEGVEEAYQFVKNIDFSKSNRKFDKI